MKMSLAICLLFACPLIQATVVCDTCSRQGCSSPIYHCPLGTHCVRNCTIAIGCEKTELIRTKIGKQFNVELPIVEHEELWVLDTVLKDEIELLYDGPAINDPELFIFNFRAKKTGTIDLVFQKIEAEQLREQEQMEQQGSNKVQPETILAEKQIAIEIRA